MGFIVKKSFVLLSALIVILGATSVRAQSLADVAKQEEARRKAIKTPAKVITNDDLKKYGSATAPATATAEQKTTPAAGQDATPPKDAAAQQPAGEQEPAKDEAYWRKRITDARATLDRSQVLADALQSRINALWADFTARDDRVQREQIEIERHKALAELDRMKTDIEAQKKAIADIEEEARQQGVPPGWLR